MPLEAMGKVLEGFGQTLGLPGLALDESGSCVLSFDDVVVNLEYREETEELQLYTVVGELPPAEQRPALYAQMLSANCLGRGTGGCQLGIDERVGVVMLSVAMDARPLDNRQFEGVIEHFVNVAERWRDKLSSGGAGDSKTAGVGEQARSSGDGARMFA